MKITYPKTIVNIDKLDRQLNQLYTFYVGSIADSRGTKLLFAGDLDDYEKQQLDSFFEAFEDGPDALADAKTRAYFRKKAGEDFDSFAIALLSSGDFSSTVDDGVLKYQGFSLIRSLIKDGLFHFALRIFVKDIEPLGVLSEEVSNSFKEALRDLARKHYNQYSIENLEQGIL